MNTLKLGKYVIDIGDISHSREMRAQSKWAKVFKGKGKIKKPEYYNKQVNKVGSYLLNQDLFILRRKLSLTDALKELLFRRFTITARYLNRLKKKEYTEFENFLSIAMTGKSLEDLEKEKEESVKKKDLMSMGIQAMKDLEVLGITIDQCSELFQTWLKEQVKKENISILIQENK